MMGEGVVNGLGEAFAGLGGGFVAKYEVIGLGEEGLDEVAPLGFIGDKGRILAVVFVKVWGERTGDVEVIGNHLACVACFGFVTGDHLLGQIGFYCLGKWDATLAAFGRQFPSA